MGDDDIHGVGTGPATVCNDSSCIGLESRAPPAGPAFSLFPSRGGIDPEFPTYLTLPYLTSLKVGPGNGALKTEAQSLTLFHYILPSLATRTLFKVNPRCSHPTPPQRKAKESKKQNTSLVYASTSVALLYAFMPSHLSHLPHHLHQPLSRFRVSARPA